MIPRFERENEPEFLRVRPVRGSAAASTTEPKWIVVAVSLVFGIAASAVGLLLFGFVARVMWEMVRWGWSALG